MEELDGGSDSVRALVGASCTIGTEVLEDL